MRYILRRPNGEEIALTRDNLAIRHENGAVRPDWLVRPEDGTDWVTVGSLLDLPAPSVLHSVTNSTFRDLLARHLDQTVEINWEDPKQYHHAKLVRVADEFFSI